MTLQDVLDGWEDVPTKLLRTLPTLTPTHVYRNNTHTHTHAGTHRHTRVHTHTHANTHTHLCVKLSSFGCLSRMSRTTEGGFRPCFSTLSHLSNPNTCTYTHTHTHLCVKLSSLGCLSRMSRTAEGGFRPCFSALCHLSRRVIPARKSLSD